jgi:hypothetical protein
MVNQDIGRKRTEIGHDNREDVFNAVRELSTHARNRDAKPTVRLEDIRNYLDKKTDYENKEIVSIMTGIYQSGFRNWTHAQLNDAIRREKKKTISYRTIQRCITNDPRIKKQGWYYFIDDEARFEKRYLNPSLEGRQLYKEFRNNMSMHYDEKYCAKNTTIILDNGYYKGGGKPPIEDEMRALVTEIGFFMVYSLIDACRPFRDKSLSLDDREDLVRYWIQNSIPVLTMLDEFLFLFKPDHNPWAKHLPTWEVEGKKKGLSVLEMDDETIKNVLTMLQEEYPTQFKIMAESTDLRGLKRMSPFIYKDGNLIHPKKEKKSR